MPGHPVLFLDTASPVVSVAIGDGGEVLAERTLALRRSSEQLLSAIEDVLRGAGLGLSELAGVAAFQGPGSFTGLRIGLATALGLHQALAVPATALPTLPILAAAGARARGGVVVAAVDAIRGEWVAQRFRLEADGARVEALAAAGRVPARVLATFAPCRLVGFGVGCLASAAWWPAAGLEPVEPPPLAGVAGRRLSAEEIDWQPARLTSPIYFRGPAVTPPKE